jgi:hypothetical protein
MRFRVEEIGRSDFYEVEVEDPSVTAADLIRFLQDEEFLGEPEDGYYVVVLPEAGREIPATVSLQDAGVADGSTVRVHQYARGAGGGAAEYLIAGAAAAKLTIDAARAGIDAYRAKTERMNAALEREKFDSDHQERRGETEPERLSPPPSRQDQA